MSLLLKIHPSVSLFMGVTVLPDLVTYPPVVPQRTMFFIGGICAAGSDDIRPRLFGWLFNNTGFRVSGDHTCTCRWTGQLQIAFGIVQNSGCNNGLVSLDGL